MHNKLNHALIMVNFFALNGWAGSLQQVSYIEREWFKMSYVMSAYVEFRDLNFKIDIMCSYSILLLIAPKRKTLQLGKHRSAENLFKYFKNINCQIL